jgi:hypothetical protein
VLKANEQGCGGIGGGVDLLGVQHVIVRPARPLLFPSVNSAGIGGALF